MNLSISVRPTLQFGLAEVKKIMFSHVRPEQKTNLESTLNDAVRRSDIMGTVYQRRKNNVP